MSRSAKAEAALALHRFGMGPRPGSITTNIESPWVIADASGKCLEIVLPGRQTRLHTVGEPRLGALRAMSFRGISGPGSDVYIVQFANGSAEWRIGLVKDGTIGRIAPGPQY